MSNLVKQYYVTNDSTPIRVVNSSNKFNQKLKAIEDAERERIERNQKSQYEEPLDASADFGDGMSDEEFVAGLDALQVETDPVEAQSMEPQEPQPDPSEEVQRILDEAREEAQRIIEEAKQQAEDELINAKAEADRLFEESKKQGYEEGSQEGMQEVEELREQLSVELSTKTKELEEDFAVKTEELESDIVEAMIQVFNKVFHIQFDNKKELLLHLIKNTLMNVEVGREFRIHVSQNNYKFINAHLEDVRERVGNDVEIEVVNDAALDSSDCQIETSFGVFDCGIDMELSNLVKDIRSLCS